MINKNFILEKFDYPFPYIKIKDFLEKDFYENLESNFPKIEEFKKFKRSVSRMDHDTTYGDDIYSNLISKSSYYKKFHDYIYSEQFIIFFLDKFKKDIKNEFENKFLTENILDYSIKSKPFEVGRIIGKKDLKKNIEKFLYPRLDLGLGIEGYGINNGGGGIHIDNPQRLISILFYLGGYKKIDGGEHRIWKKSNSKDTLELHETIKAEKNTLIAGLQNNLAFHDVNPIKSIDGTRNAFYLAISSTVPIWKKVKSDKFNITYNRNRVKFNIFHKIKNIFLSNR